MSIHARSVPAAAPNPGGSAAALHLRLLGSGQEEGPRGRVMARR